MTALIYRNALIWCRKVQNSRMWVFNSVSTAQQICSGKWRGHMATHASTQKLTTKINGILVLCAGWGNLILIHKMAISDYPPLVPPPLNCNCLLATTKPSLQTTTGRCFQILCCIEIVEGSYFSHNLLCCYRTAASALNLASEPWILDSPTPTGHSIPLFVPPSPHWPNFDQVNMPSLHHWMRYRRGYSRGRVIPPPLLSLSDSTTSDSSSPLITTHFKSRYPATRNGRGHAGCAQTAIHRHVEDAPQPPAAFGPTLQPSHSTQFQFHCTLERPYVIATLSVTFRGEPQSSNVLACNIRDSTNTSRRKTHGSSSGTRKTHDEAPDRTCAAQGHNILGSYMNMEATMRDQQHKEDDMEAYRCLIVEEPLPPNDA